MDPPDDDDYNSEEDEDYVPANVAEGSGSDSGSSDDGDDVNEAQNDEQDAEIEADRKRRIDDLWGDFKKSKVPDSAKKPKLSSTLTPSLTSVEAEVSTSSPILDESKKEVPADQTSGSEQKSALSINPASENVDDSKTAELLESKLAEKPKLPPVRQKPLGLSGVLDSISKKKITTLEKSKLDWDSFKSKHGIREELSTFNRGKNGFVDRQQFLERSDLRQFEREKMLKKSGPR